MKKRLKTRFALLLILCLTAGMTGCGMNSGSSLEDQAGGFVYIEEEAAILAESPAARTHPESVVPEASGKLVKESADAVIDYSNTSDGYIMVKYKKETDRTIKSQVKGPDTTYTYNVKPGEWQVFPLTDGNGPYKVSVLKHVSGNKYAVALSQSFTVKVENEFAPFLLSNQYVNYADAPETVKKAASLCKKAKEPLQKVEKVYNYVIKNMTYDKKKAQTVKSGYLPDLDQVLKAKKGICFDYASLMAGMLRSEGVPCKLVVGYAGEAYHAWISVWVEGEGWIEGVVYFDGEHWQRMDPTFASSGGQSKSIMKYIGDGENYTAKYFY